VFPATRHQRCRVHKSANVPNALPKSAQPGAKKALQEIYNAEDRDRALKAITAFEKAYGAKFPKVVKKITDDSVGVDDDLLVGRVSIVLRLLGHGVITGGDQSSVNDQDRAPAEPLALLEREQRCDVVEDAADCRL
jgi:hypothetical protein